MRRAQKARGGGFKIPKTTKPKTSRQEGFAGDGWEGGNYEREEVALAEGEVRPESILR